MSRWFRHYAGMMRDDKLVSVAIKAKQPVERVVWVWGAILESAAEIDDGGRFNLDAAEVAYFLRTDEADIGLILDALGSMGRLSDDRVVKWGERQFTSDRSADRQAKYRERKRSETVGSDEHKPSGDAVVTSPSRHGDAPYTETYTELEVDAAQSRKRSRAELDRLEADLREAAGFQTNPSPGLFVLAPILGLLDIGYDIEADILPTVRAVASRMKRPARSWDYFVEPIREAIADRQAVAARGRAPPGKHQSSGTGRTNVFERLKGQADERGGKDGSSGPVVDAVRSIPDLRRQDERDDGQGIPAGDRWVLPARAS